MPPGPRVIGDGAAPHPPPFHTGFPFDRLIAVAVGGDRMAVADQPFADIPAVAGRDADRPVVFVDLHDRDMDVSAADFLDQGALDALALIEPVAVPVHRPVVEFRRVEAGEPDLVAGDAQPVAVRDIGLAGDRARPPPFPPTPEEQEDDDPDGQKSE